MTITVPLVITAAMKMGAALAVPESGGDGGIG